MQNELVSIIIPVYKVEKYLENCLSSVVNQTYQNLEIILVDDGSPDRCPAICDAWAEKDDRIHVIHKQNQGLGMARNTGLDCASGQYICFFDSDDFIAPDAIEKACAQIKKHKAQIVCFGYHAVNEAGAVCRSFIPECAKEVFTGDEVQAAFLPMLISNDPASAPRSRLWMSAWAAMYSAETIRRHHWRFVSEREILSEDIYSLLVLYKDITTVSVLGEALYYYRRNNSSLSRIYREDRFLKNVHFYEESLNACSRCNYNDAVKRAVGRYFFSNVIGVMKQIVRAPKPLHIRYAELKRVIFHEVWKKPIMQENIHHEKPARKILLRCILRRRVLACYIMCRIKK